VNNDAISVDKTPIEQAQGPLDIERELGYINVYF
jgi:hypothetical protein